MRQKYRILRNDEKNELIIREFAALDKETLTFICEEKFGRADVEVAIKKGRDALVSVLRTRNMYPPGLYMDGITNTVKSLYSGDHEDEDDGENHVAEVSFDDAAFLSVEPEEPEVVAEEVEEEPAENIDDLLEDDIDGNFEGKTTINTISARLKIADDESLDVAEDV